MDYVSASEWGAQYGYSRQWSCKLVRDGRVPSAVLVGREWCVPRDAPAPDRLTPGRVANPESKAVLRERERVAARVAREAALVAAVRPRIAGVASAHDWDARQRQIADLIEADGRIVDFGQVMLTPAIKGARFEDWDSEDQAFYDRYMAVHRPHG